MAFIKPQYIKKVDISKKRSDFLEFLNTIWIFFQDQILGMKFLNLLIGDVLSVAGVDIGGRWAEVFNFFCMTWSKLQFCYAC